MGARNALAAFVTWPRLEDKPKVILQYMALVTLDSPSETQPARLYWAGRDALAEVALGRDLPTEPDAADRTPEAEAARRARRAAFEAVRTALAALVDAGAVTRLRPGGRGRQAEYRLNLDVFAVPDLAEPGAPIQAEPGPMNQAQPGPKAQAEPGPKAQAQPGPEEEPRNNRREPGGQPRLAQTSHLGSTSAGHKGEMSAGGATSSTAPVHRLQGLVHQRATARPTWPGDAGGRPEWCGVCDEATRLEVDDHGAVEPWRKCPRCHPWAVSR